MSSARSQRLAREFKTLSTKPPWGVSCSTEKEDVYDVILINMSGPKNSPYESGIFKLIINVPDKYPFEPPQVKFVTPVYHPNIDSVGRICMNMLKMPPKGSWLPTITIETLLISIQTLLANPNPDDPLVLEIALEFKCNKDEFLEKAKRYTKEHATS
ncbi:ubiquitin-conjugating enzyme E2 T-like [Leptidea sinapis]|uniref:ubiquitin-conjugating enzyme E2 T-like n=1 Tax=Leptidea sinapis TaxID=189913 RepID=UPI00212013A0|nr:ubiquitin-conjugating enzyme E2 T-like [Leptidea sinapis]